MSVHGMNRDGIGIVIGIGNGIMIGIGIGFGFVIGIDCTIYSGNTTQVTLIHLICEWAHFGRLRKDSQRMCI